MTWLYAQTRSGGRRHPGRAANLLARLALAPPPTVVRVVGTNGKGSVTAMIAHGLSHSGRVTGRFLSPHVEEFRERIAVDGVAISEAQVVDFVARAMATQPFEDDLHPAFFDWVLALALEHFERSGVATAVLEAGVGGASDATSVAATSRERGAVELVVLTNVTPEHLDTLGPTLADAARDKAGAFAPGAPAVTGASSEALAVARQVAAERGITLHVDPYVAAGGDQVTQGHLSSESRSESSVWSGRDQTATAALGQGRGQAVSLSLGQDRDQAVSLSLGQDRDQAVSLSLGQGRDQTQAVVATAPPPDPRALFALPDGLARPPTGTRAANARLAAAALRLLGADERAVAAALDAPPLPGRGEHFQVGDVKVLLDGAHDPAAAAALRAEVEPGYVLLFGALRRKQATATLRVLERGATAVVLTEAAAGEAPPEATAAANSRAVTDPAAALSLALELAVANPGAGSPGAQSRAAQNRGAVNVDAENRDAESSSAASSAPRTVVIAGSLYLAGRLRPLLRAAAAAQGTARPAG